MPSAHWGARVDSREVRSRHPLNIRVRCRCRCAPLPVGRTEKAGLHWLPFSTAVQESQISLVPGERIELPTNGLQNRCSTAELTRLTRCSCNINQFFIFAKPLVLCLNLCLL